MIQQYVIQQYVIQQYVIQQPSTNLASVLTILCLSPAMIFLISTLPSSINNQPGSIGLDDPLLEASHDLPGLLVLVLVPLDSLQEVGQFLLLLLVVALEQLELSSQLLQLAAGV